MKLTYIVAATLTGTALFAGSTSAHPRQAGAVFVQNDNPAGNTIVAYDRNADGTLKQAGSYPTGGLGGVLAGSVVDHLASQGSLQLDKGLLYAVNAGQRHDHRVRRRRRPPHPPPGAPQLRRLPGQHHRAWQPRLCPQRARRRLDPRLHPRRRAPRAGPAWHRSLKLDPNATPEFTHTPGQVAFTPDGNHLIIPTKSGSDAVQVFDVGPFGPSLRPTVTGFPGAGPFAVAFDTRGRSCSPRSAPAPSRR